MFQWYFGVTCHLGAVIAAILNFLAPKNKMAVSLPIVCLTNRIYEIKKSILMIIYLIYKRHFFPKPLTKELWLKI